MSRPQFSLRLLLAMPLLAGLIGYGQANYLGCGPDGHGRGMPRPHRDLTRKARTRVCPISWNRPNGPVDRPGFPPLHRAQIVRLACLEPIAKGLHIAHWTSQDLARQAIQDGIVPYISPRTAVTGVPYGFRAGFHRTIVGDGDGRVGLQGGESTMRRARVSSGVGLLAALGVVAAAAVTVRAVDDKDKVAPGRRRPGGAEGVRPARGVVARGRAGPEGTVARGLDGVGGLGLEVHQRLGRTGDKGQEGQVLQGGRASAGQGVPHVRLRGDPRRRHVAHLCRRGGDEERLVLTAGAKSPAGGVRRVSITPLHGTRLLVLLEAKDPELHTFSRLGEVGYSREGVAFAAGDSYPLCIVTEGRGTIQVKYKGKTYWVCCSGCRDMFKDDPESVLAAAAAREGQGEKVTPGFR